VVQLLVISTYFSRDAFALMLNLTSAMSLIPYLFVAVFGVMNANRGDGYDVRPEERRRDMIMAAIAVIYTAFMIFAGGIKFILLSAVLFAPGTALYFWARREQNKNVFITSDWIIFIVIGIGAIIGIYALVTGRITI
jgi:arginine:ornithine antiporter/lysine permease